MGKRRTPELAARYADEFNLPFVDEERARTQFDRVRAACEDADRDPDDLIWSNALTALRRRRRGRAGPPGRGDRRGRRRPARERASAGTPAEVVDKLGRYAALGSQRAYLQVLDLSDLDHLRLVAEEVAPHV